MKDASAGAAKKPDDGKRAPYEPPAVLFVERLEAQAEVCSAPGKGDPSSCPLGPVSS